MQNIAKCYLDQVPHFCCGELWLKINKTKAVKEIRKKIAIIQREHDIDTEMYINSFYSPLIELWILDGDWEKIADNVEAGEGDVVRSFKRTVDVLRQITILPNINPELAEKAKEAIEKIMKEPIDVD